MGKFQTTNSALFNNNNSTIMPEWMQSFSDELKIKEQRKIELNFDKKGSFADVANVNRPDCIATPREVVASFNKDKAIIDSKIELAKFLKGKYYKTSAKVAGNSVLMNTTIDGLQANFVFEYKFLNNKICQADTFIINESEYPFSRAGFNESLQDLKCGNLKKTKVAVASSRQTYVINREEIIRRFNGHLREATDSINKKLKDGILVGAGSNTYATFYDPEELFPQIEKEKPEDKLPSFEYVDNTEHVATNEFKSAKNLSFVAGKLISKVFADYIINSSKRCNNKLIVDATVLNNSTGIRHNIDFNFDIVNEKITQIAGAKYDNKLLSIEDLISSLNKRNNLVSDYLKTSTASKRIHNGGILTRREIESQLSTIVNTEKISDFISSWLDLNMITQVGSNVYSTSKTMPELLDTIVAETLSTEEKEKIANYKKKFGSGMDFDRIEQEDTGVREADDVELSVQQKLSMINNELSKNFKNYQITSFNNNNINAMFISDGVRHTIKLTAKFNNRKLDTITASINNKEVKIANLIKAFKNNALLNQYLQKSGANNFSTNIVATESNLLERLSQLTTNAQEILNGWKEKHLTNIGCNLYSSRYTFEELLNMTNAILLSEDDKQQILAAKQHFGTSLERIKQADTGVRDAEDYVTNETLLYSANNYLAKHLNNYSPKHFASMKNSANYSIDIFDDSTGLSTNILFNFKFDNNNVVECTANLNGKKVTLDNIKMAFAMNESLNKYLQIHGGKKFNAPMVITRNDLLRKLSSITNASTKEVDGIISLWKKQGKITNLSQNTFASKCSLEQLITMSNIKPLSDDEIAMKLDKSRRDKLFNITSNYIQDNDTRRPEVEHSAKQMAIRARIAINSMFADFDILDAKFDGDDYEITTKIINPINGLRQALKFKFNTCEGKRLGEIETVSDGTRVVDINNILSLLESNNDAIKKLSGLYKNDKRRNSQKNIILNSSLKSTLLNFIDMSTYYKVVDDLMKSGVIYKLDNDKFASEYSFPDLIEYLSDKDKLDLITAETRLKTYSADLVVDINGPIVMDTDNRTIEKPEQHLSPKMIETARKLKKLIAKAQSDKKITANKFNSLNLSLDNSKTPNDIENIWRELKKYM